jgi:phenylacetate-CoA ligase
MISEKSLDLFKRAAQDIPAYTSFLAARGLDPHSVANKDQYQSIPVTNKKDYLQAYSRPDLIWPKNQAEALWYCSTSGSTGEPYYFPRTDEIAARGSWFAEAFLKHSGHGQGSTLVIIAFGMGVWIGGVVTLRSFEIAAERSPSPVAFLPTGYNKTEIFKALRKLSPEYDQTILVGYPPFVKEVLDEAKNEGIDPKALHMRLIFAAEAFTETFRDYVSEKAGVANPLLDTLNIYGTADMGAMAYETPLSILIRKIALQNPLIYQDTFGQIEKTPTLAQYHPDFIEFEAVDGELLITSDGAIPLIRYAIGDHGGIFTYDEIEKLLHHYDIDLASEIQKHGIGDTISRRPFVFVYERTDLSATLHGIIIYPEFIKEGLLHPEATAHFTERFTMTTKSDIHHNQYLEVNLELQKSLESSLAAEELGLKIIRNTLIAKSSEFSEISKSTDGKQLIKVIIWPNEHPRYFAAGTKQQWVKKA